ncbi:MAG TPA: Crp/Fnr family transcriptional regulator [Rhizomicrobium sp.]|nr:Crp/Fnr family transcriptional regulator [Rhizomicrobium sp.]
MSPSLKPFLDQLKLRAPLDDDAQRIILSLDFEVQEMGREQALIQHGETPKRICVIADGVAARCGRTLEGSRQITAIHVSGDMPGLPSLMLPSAGFSLCTLTKSRLLWVNRSELKQAARHPQIMEAFWRLALVDLAIAWEWEVNIGRRPAEKRVAHLVCELACRMNALARPGCAFQLGLTQQQFADSCGISVVHANRCFQALRRERLLEAKGDWIAIADWDRLAEWAEFDDAYLHRAGTGLSTGWAGGQSVSAPAATI